MRLRANIIIIVFVIIAMPGICISEDNCKYINSVQNFYKTMQGCKHYKISDYLSLFGKNNEAELEMILDKLFNLPIDSEEITRNKDIVNKVNTVLNNPNNDSEFLKLLCAADSLSLRKNKNFERSITFPIQETNNLIHVEILEGNKKIIFEFSKGESYIENIYLPDGKSVYTLIKHPSKKIPTESSLDK